MFLNKTTEVATVFLYISYSCMFFFTDAEWYYDLYDFLCKFDTFIFIYSILGAIYFINTWKRESKICLIYLVLFNILTELSNRIEVPNYYEIYSGCMIASILTIIFSKPK